MANRRHAPALAGAFLLIGAGICGAAAAPVAAPATGKVSGPVTGVTPVAAVTEGEDEAANCSRSRRRLWVEGEGWIVRRVTTCR